MKARAAVTVDEILSVAVNVKPPFQAQVWKQEVQLLLRTTQLMACGQIVLQYVLNTAHEQLYQVKCEPIYSDCGTDGCICGLDWIA